MTVTLFGVCYDGASSFERGTALGPAAVREALRRGSSNTWTESGLDVAAPSVLDDAGDLTPPDGAAGRAAVEEAVTRLLDDGRTPLIVGGDHSITYPIVRAFRHRYPRLQLLHFDAHPDLYDELDGDRYSHACPMARILEEGLIDRLVQIGIRTFTGHQRDQARRFGVESHEAKDWTGPPTLRFAAPVYVSLDLDVLDPAFAPGISHPEPGGLTVRDVIAVLQRLEATVVGADVVELNPRRDDSPRTGLVAAKLVKELVDRLSRSPSLSRPGAAP